MKKIGKCILYCLTMLFIVGSVVGCVPFLQQKPKPEPIKVMITPDQALMLCGEVKQYYAIVTPTDTEHTDVDWSLSDPLNTGSVIDDDGMLTAGQTAGMVVVKAALKSDADIYNVATVKIEGEEEPEPPIEPEVPLDPNVLFFDDFNGNSLDLTKWKHMVGTRDEEVNGPYDWGNGEAQYYQPDNTTISDGILKVTAKRESKGGKEWTSSRFITRGNFSFTYGRAEARMKLPDKTGFWPAFWMMPELNSPYGNWPHSGEIDIMEARGRLPDEVSSAVHYNDWGHQYKSETFAFPAGQTITDFHVYAVEWYPDRLDFFVDETMYFSMTDWKPNPAPFDTDFYLLLNLAVGGMFDSGRLPNAGVKQASMEVDYVKVTKLEG